MLGKPGPLDENERKLVREHPLIGSRLLAGSASPVLRVAEAIARAHHERWDGSGYPAGLRGDEIPVEARIVAVVDTYDALRSPRSYKRPYPHEEAVAVILRGDGRTLPVHFDPALLVLLAEIAPELDRIWRESPEGHGLAGNASPPLSQPNRA